MKEIGEVEGTLEAFNLALGAGDPEESPRAAFDLGLLLLDGGELEAARRALLAARGTKHPEELPRVLYNRSDDLLGVHLARSDVPRR